MSIRPSQKLTGRKTILPQPWVYNYEYQASTGLACIHMEQVGSSCTKKSTLALHRSIITSEDNFILLITTCDAIVWNHIYMVTRVWFILYVLRGMFFVSA